MQLISNPPALSFEYAYANYASQLYGMILHCIQCPVVSHTILEEIFTSINYQIYNKSNLYPKLACKARQLISSYINTNPTAFKNNHHYILNNTEITGEQLLKLVYTGRYSITEIKEITGIDETIIRQKIVTAVKNKVKLR
jgi:hypothetical protein